MPQTYIIITFKKSYVSIIPGVSFLAATQSRKGLISQNQLLILVSALSLSENDILNYFWLVKIALKSQKKKKGHTHSNPCKIAFSYKLYQLKRLQSVETCQKNLHIYCSKSAGTLGSFMNQISKICFINNEVSLRNLLHET